MKKSLLLAAASAALIAAPAAAQTTTADNPIARILGNLLGWGNSSTNSLEGQWNANRRPLGNQRAEFEARVNSEVSAGRMSSADGARLKSDYYTLVQLETQYGANGSFSTTERSDLTTRYNALLQVLADGRYGDTLDDTFGSRAEVSEGQAEFNARVDAAVSARRITSRAGTRLKNDYAALIRTETNYLRDGVLSEYERQDLDARLDALDQRVGDLGYGTVTTRSRLDAIFRALPSSGLSSAARAQLLVEHGDLTRLEAAYARLTPTAEERAYLESRLANLETRARVNQ